MSRKRVHELKITPFHFAEVMAGTKSFEIRKNDRDFHTGDILLLKEWDGEKFTGESVRMYVPYILHEFPDGLIPGYCIMSIRPTKN